MAKILKGKAKKAKLKQLHSDIAGPEMVYPSTVDIKGDQLPEMKSWKLGETYEVTMKLKMRSISEGGYDGKQPLRGTFEIIGMAKDDDESDEED